MHLKVMQLLQVSSIITMTTAEISEICEEACVRYWGEILFSLKILTHLENAFSPLHPCWSPLTCNGCQFACACLKTKYAQFPYSPSSAKTLLLVETRCRSHDCTWVIACSVHFTANFYDICKSDEYLIMCDILSSSADFAGYLRRKILSSLIKVPCTAFTTDCADILYPEKPSGCLMWEGGVVRLWCLRGGSKWWGRSREGVQRGRGSVPFARW